MDQDELKSVLFFLKEFQTSVLTPSEDYDSVDQHDDKIKNLYEHEWNRYSENYFKNEAWPTVEKIEEHGLELEDEFKILYKELYYRHIFDRIGNTKKGSDKESDFGSMTYERFKSWQNYVDLFNLIINTDKVPEWSLPSTWLWDIMDEFIYQFTQFRTFRSKLQSKSNAELEFLREAEETSPLWGIHSVLNVLYSIVEKSCIIQSLEAALGSSGKSKTNRQPSQFDEFADSEMYKYLGYFSLIGLLKFHVLTGDYQLAIDSIKNQPIEMLYELNENEWFITSYYHYGFALVMTKRYKEAIIRFQSALNFVDRSNKIQTRQIQYKNEQQNKQIEQLYHLLAVCVTLYPMKLEDSIEAKMKERVGDDKINRMQSGDAKVFDEIFSKASPRFVPLGEPDLDSGKNVNFANTNLQKKVFVDEIRSQLQLPAIRRYLKLYTTMELPKLSSFLSKSSDKFSYDYMSSDEATLSYLMCCKVKMAVASGEDFNKTCPSHSEILNGKVDEEDGENENSPADDVPLTVDFYVDNNMVHIADTKVDSTYGRNFLRLIESYRKIESNAVRCGKAIE